MHGGTRRTARTALQVLSLLLLAAHFYRGGLYPLVVATVAMAGLTFVARPWAGRVLAIVLLLGTAEWLRTAWALAHLRASLHQPYGRLVAILGAVAAVTLVSAFVARGSGAPVARPQTD
jgi:hypothetical protein